MYGAERESDYLWFFRNYMLLRVKRRISVSYNQVIDIG